MDVKVSVDVGFVAKLLGESHFSQQPSNSPYILQIEIVPSVNANDVPLLFVLFSSADLRAAANPGFFAAMSLAYYAGFTIFVFFLMVIVPGGVLGYTMSHLVPEDPPWNRKRRGATPNDERLPYIVASGSHT